MRFYLSDGSAIDKFADEDMQSFLYKVVSEKCGLDIANYLSKTISELNEEIAYLKDELSKSDDEIFELQNELSFYE